MDTTDINENVMEYIKDYIEELLDDLSDILMYEKEYDYYVDEVALLLNPNVVNVFLYTKDLRKTRTYLTDAGLNITTCKHIQGEAYAAHYKDMLHVRVTGDEALYKEKESKNDKLRTISLSNIVSSFKDKGLAECVIIDKLLEMAEYTGR